MNRLIITDSEIRIINADNPGQYHVWPVSEGLEPARKVAEAWEDAELLRSIDNAADPLALKQHWDEAKADMAEGGLVDDPPEVHPAKPRRGRKPKALTSSQ